MDIIVALAHRDPEDRGALILAIRRLAPDDAAVVDGGDELGVVYLRISSRSNIDDASARAIQVVALAGVAADRTFAVTTGDLSWPPYQEVGARRGRRGRFAREYLYG
jgi:hypothetical protein